MTSLALLAVLLSTLACRPAAPQPALPTAAPTGTAAATSQPDTSVTLAARGRPATVVVETALEDQVCFAVSDLTNYLTRITGVPARLTTTPPEGPAIHIGRVGANRDLEKRVTPLGRDGFVVDVSAGYGVRVAGNTKFGIAYGINELLEMIGVRWLAPGEWGEVVPEMDQITLPTGSRAEAPAFEVRQLHAAYVGLPFGEWARRMRHNRCGFGGHSGIVNPRRHGTEHPEWYAEVDGKRQPEARLFKLCHSNSNMVSQAIAEVLDSLRKREANTNQISHIGYRHLNSDYQAISISPTDGGGFCQCRECLAQGSLPDRLQRFANQIASAIQTEFPGKEVGYYGAYSSHQEPPAVRADDRVIVFMTTWSRSFFEPLAARSNNAFRDKLAAYADTCPKIVLRDYDGLSSWWGFGPYTLADIHAADYRTYLQEYGVKGIVTEAHIGWVPRGYSYYLTSKLWWNPDLDLAALKEDYVVTGFGEAAAPMRRYHQRLDKAVVYPAPAVLYAMRQDLEEAARLARRLDVVRRVDTMRASYYLLDIYNALQNGVEDEALTLRALRLLKSIDPYASPITVKHFTKHFKGELPEIEPLTGIELRQLLDGVELMEPRNFASWSAADSAKLQPWPANSGEWEDDMGANYRYGPHDFLIYAEAGERLQVSQRGRSRTEYHLSGTEMATLASGSVTSEADEEALLVDRIVDASGLYRLSLTTRGNRPRILIKNRSAVVEASSAQQHLHPMHRSFLYFYVPRGTREFAIVTKPEEPLYLTVYGPHDAAEPFYPRTGQHATIFMEHLITVPEGADGTAWRMRVDGEDKKIFLLGIPPFLSSHYERLLLPAGEEPRKLD